MKRIVISAALAIAALLCGCATNSPTSSAGDAQTATCNVCRYNNDLACVEFRRKQTTPTAEYQGNTYCFCSKSCQAAFVKNPGKYARVKSSATAVH